MIFGSSYAAPYRPRLAFGRRAAVDIALGAVPALVLGYIVGHGLEARLPIVAAFTAIAAVVLLFTSPRLAAVAMGASIPALQDLLRGHQSFHLTASDVVLVVIGARILGDTTLLRTTFAFRALRPLRFPVLQYVWFVLLLLAIHPGLGSVLKGAQRLELLLLPVLVGAYVAIRREHMLVIRGYVVASTVLAVVWPLHLFHIQTELQKNPTGQLLANALLLLIGVRSLRRLLPCVPVLLVGLFLTASRGAILALLVGIAVIVLIHTGPNLRLAFARILPIGIAALVIFQWLPINVRSHVSELSANSSSSSAGYSIYIRDEYQHQATRLIAAHPWTGVGVGNYYLPGNAITPTTSLDPHNVILLQAAEGGYLFAASFVVLLLGAVLAMWRLRHIELAVAAIAVLVATFSHGLVDVYWVRGTPLLGWLLAGIVCGVAWRQRRELEA
jgi:hypothetical protein